MERRVVLNLGAGDWHRGFASVMVQLWIDDNPAPMQFQGSLPAMPVLEELYQCWQQLYEALYAHRSWRQQRMAPPEFELDDTENYVTDVSEAAFYEVCENLRDRFNTWLNAETFRPIDRQLRTHLSITDDIRCIITANDPRILHLPWGIWNFFDDYSKAELALSLAEYTRSPKVPTSPKSTVNILAILGNAQGINVTQDQKVLEQLPQAHLVWLIEPTLAELHHQLWQSNWDILFFAGHSSTQDTASQKKATGKIDVNANESLTIADLKFALKSAISRGLKLAIFNSCDGLGLAWDLADVQIPQVIVMREPVPDRVAQEFLKHFLTAFSNGQSLYLSVRESRERLQGLEREFLCASWLPVICQNPAEFPPLWMDWIEQNAEVKQRSKDIAARDGKAENRPPSSSSPSSRSLFPSATFAKLSTIFLSSLVATGFVMGVRSLGWLQSLELWAFDRTLVLRPTELPDPRILIVTIDEADIQAQPVSERRGSLSDAALSQLITALLQYQPRAIGIDVYRDFPVSSKFPGLVQQLKKESRIFAICKGRDSQYDSVGIAPPPEVPEARVGFSDFLPDDDGVLRRQILIMTPDPASPCTTPYAFNARLVFEYLKAEGLEPTFNSDGNLVLGQVLFRHLSDRTSGYQSINAAGDQLILNYRALSSPDQIASQVSLADVMSGKISAKAVRDRVVLVGVTANSSGDLWQTPFGSNEAQKIAGVYIQAQMVSQLLSAVLDQRPLIRSWHWFGETNWVLGWSILAGISIRLVQLHRQSLWLLFIKVVGMSVIISVALIGSSTILMTQGIWVPLMPALISFMLVVGVISLSRKLNWS